MLTIFLRLIRKKDFLRRQLASGTASVFSSPGPPAFLLKYCTIESLQVNGRSVYTLIPKNTISRKHILYLHGGAYVQGLLFWHWRFIGRLMRHCHCTITVPDYPLAPARTYVDSFEMVQSLYRRLIVSTASSDFIFMGDSSGGGFALALAQSLEREKNAQPGQLILLSPWLDITLTNPDIEPLEAVDPFLDRGSLQTAGKLYAGYTPTDHFLLSPVNGSLDGLGKITVFTSSKDLLVADARRLRAMAIDQGIDLLYYEYPEMVHAWMFLSLPESKQAVRQIIGLIKS
jgi:monoterpene epsilon-lactone hydrolase